MIEPADLQSVAASGVKRALAQGASKAEVYVVASRTTKIGAEGPYAMPQESAHEGLALRVELHGRIGQAGTTGLHDVDSLVAHALRSAETVGRAAGGLALAPAASRFERCAHPVVAGRDADRLDGLARGLSERLLARPDATYARAVVSGSLKRVAIASSEGLEAYHEAANESAEFEVRLTRGTTDRTASDLVKSTRPIGSSQLDALVDEGLRQAAAAMETQPLSRSVEDVIFAPHPASQVLGVLLGALSGVAVSAGKSPLAGRIGEQVMSPKVTLVDRPQAEAGRARRIFDDEGTPTQETTLVRAGQLESHYHNLASATALGHAPTGHGIRSDTMSAVGARCINLALEGGDSTLEEMIEQSERAVLVNQPMLGAFVASRVTGDFSLVAPFAFYVENGRIRHALPATTVGGNALRVLERVVDLGTDGRPFRAGTVPSLRTGGVSCAT